MPDVSVIIPAFNTARTIERCLDSLLAQQADVEIIVVDDCSTDATWEICRRYAARFDRVRAVRNERNVGQGLSRNRGIELARGEYLAFVDSDDYVDRHMYEDMLALAQGRHDVVGCKLARAYGLRHSLPDVTRRLEAPRRFDGHQISREVMTVMLGPLPGERRRELPFPWSPCTYLYRTELVRQRGIRFESERRLYSEDLFFNLEVLRAASSLATTQSRYYVYQDNPGSTVYHYHDPTAKCHRILGVAASLGEGEPVLRARRTVLSCMMDAAIQLAFDDTMSWPRKRQVLRELLDERLFAEVMDVYPTERLSIRCNVFLACARRGWTSAMLVLGRLNTLRRRTYDWVVWLGRMCAPAMAALRPRAPRALLDRLPGGLRHQGGTRA